MSLALRLVRFFVDARHADTVAFSATLACMWITAHFALKLPRRTARLFGATALFALNWALLLLYYLPGPPQDEILSSFSGFLLVYVGSLLTREAFPNPEIRQSASIGWLDALPLQLLRVTAVGYGLYVIVWRIYGVEYGLSTLALALWGTVLTILGYLAIWFGMVSLYQGSRSFHKVAAWLGLLLIAYSACEVTYSVWYAQNYWPPYHRYVELMARRKLPRTAITIPVSPEPDWPAYPAWKRLMAEKSWPSTQALLSLQLQPNVPDMWIWLKYAYSALKLIFTVLFLSLLWRRPDEVTGQSSSMLRWLQIKIGPKWGRRR